MKNINNDKKFIDAIFLELFDKNFARYKKALSEPRDGGIDPYARARNSLASLSESERRDVINFMQVVIADSASLVFGVLDGTFYPGEFQGELVLRCDDEDIQGDLQDLFIEKAQEKNVYE